VGVVGATAYDRLDTDPPPMLFVPESRSPRTTRFVVVRSDRDPALLLSAIRDRIRQLDSSVPMTDVMTMEARLASSLAQQRFRAAIVGGLTVFAVLLSIVGIYGVVAYAVSRRTREIGIRMALGEDANRVRRRIIGSVLRTAGLGVALGLIGSFFAGNWLATQLVGVTPHDPRHLLAAAVAALGIAMVAAYVPARRASRVDPLVALRAD
jgi:putative ABC transport system permease protein